MSYRYDMALSFAGEDVLRADYLPAKESGASTSPDRAPKRWLERSDLRVTSAYDVYDFRASERLPEELRPNAFSRLSFS